MKDKRKKEYEIGTPVRPLFAYYLTVGLVFLVSFFPENRIWGFNQWAYFPLGWRLLLISVGLLLPLIWSLLSGDKLKSFREKLITSLDGRGTYLGLAAFVTIAMGIGFYFLRAKTHFLGDGYMNLSSLASEKPLIKDTAFGEVKVHIWLKSLLGGGEPAALLSFQIISIVSGILFLMVVFYMARKLFENRLESFLFSLGLASGGYLLLFFGYVEYYSLFVLSVTIYTLAGLLIINGKLNKWLVIPFFLPTVLFHILGITLLPSVLFLLFSGTTLGKFFQNLSKKTKLFLSTVGGIALLSVFIYFYLNSYRFRFAVVPILTDRFTVEGYTLFSVKHIIDFLNLLFLLVPGLLVFLVLTSKLRLRETFRQKPFQYLLVLTISTLGAVSLIDPKLGMPRDWDLFSFCGIPLAVIIHYTILIKSQVVGKYVAVGLMIALGFFSLFPRAIRQFTPDIAVAEFNTLAVLDISKNRVSRNLLVDYYRKIGDSANVMIESEKWFSDYPETFVPRKVDSLARANKQQEAILYGKRMILKNPMFSVSYYTVGAEYLAAVNLDSAILYLEIANAMSPDIPDFMFVLGAAYFEKGENEIAYEYFRRAISKGLDSVVVRQLERAYPMLKR